MSDEERDEDVGALYDGPPIRTRMIAWLLLGIGGLVMVPIGLINRALWLLVLAVPLLLVGLVLLLIRLHIGVEYGTDVVRVTNIFMGLKLRKRQYPLASVADLDLRRVAGDERERPSDTWYLELRLHTTVRAYGRVEPRTKIYTVGKYDSRLSALEARRRLRKMLQAPPQT